MRFGFVVGVYAWIKSSGKGKEREERKGKER